MKQLFYFLFFTILFTSCCKTNEHKTVQPIEKTAVYNDSLAKKIGADDYGMKKYVIAFLKRGPNTGLDSITKSQLQRAHLDNITKLAEEGKLVLAGPFFGNEDLRGIYIFDVQSVEEAQKLTETDPSIKEGILTMELKEWYGSAALVMLNDFHKQITKTEI